MYRSRADPLASVGYRRNSDVMHPSRVLDEGAALRLCERARVIVSVQADAPLPGERAPAPRGRSVPCRGQFGRAARAPRAAPPEGYPARAGAARSALRPGPLLHRWQLCPLRAPLTRRGREPARWAPTALRVAPPGRRPPRPAKAPQRTTPAGRDRAPPACAGAAAGSRVRAHPPSPARHPSAGARRARPTASLVSFEEGYPAWPTKSLDHTPADRAKKVTSGRSSRAQSGATTALTRRMRPPRIRGSGLLLGGRSRKRSSR
jgi:hypothetical protein